MWTQCVLVFNCQSGLMYVSAITHTAYDREKVLYYILKNPPYIIRLVCVRVSNWLMRVTPDGSYRYEAVKR